MFMQKTVDSIVEKFHRTIAELRDHAESMKARADEHSQKAEEHTASAQECLNEHTRANVVADRLKGIIGA